MYVYILTTDHSPAHYYIGSSTNLKRRLTEHSAGQCAHTSKYKPWKVKNAFWFHDGEKAHAFERCLKSSSGRAFAKKHF